VVTRFRPQSDQHCFFASPRLLLGRITFTQCIYAAYCYRCRMFFLSVCLSLCLSVCVTVTRMYCAKTTEPIEMPFERLTGVGQRNRVLDGSRSFTRILGVVRPTEYHLESLLRCTQYKDHSVLNNGTIPGLLQPTAMLPTGRCLITLSP